MGDLRDRYISPLRYPGGKAALGPFFRALVVENDLEGGEYVEAYAGGASVGLALLVDELVERIVINDRDPAIYAFWRAVVHETDRFCDRIEATPVTIAQWRKQRAVYSDASSSAFERGFAAFFLNRTNRSGVIASGRPIGGLAQTGDHKIDARYNKPGLIERVKRIGSFRNRVTILNLDATSLVRHRKHNRRSLWYLDPPYYGSNYQRLYSNYYTHNEHVAVANALASTAQHWVVTYDNVPQIRALYAHHAGFEYNLRYVAAQRRVGSELMFFSHKLRYRDSRSIALGSQDD